MDNENVGLNQRKKHKDMNPQIHVIVPANVIAKTKKIGAGEGGVKVTASIKRPNKHQIQKKLTDVSTRDKNGGSLVVSHLMGEFAQNNNGNSKKKLGGKKVDKQEQGKSGKNMTNKHIKGGHSRRRSSMLLT